MKRHRSIFLAFIIIATAVCPLAGQNHSRKVDKQFTVTAAPKVTVDGKFGPILVKGWDKSIVEVHVTIDAEAESEARAKELAESVDVDITASQNEITVETKNLKDVHTDSRQSVKISTVMNVPKKSMLSVDNRFGNTSIDHVDGSVRIDAEYGSTEVQNCSNVTVESKFGSTTLTSIDGNLSVQGKNGKIRAYDIAGGSFENKFGATEISNSKGAVSIENKMGSIHAKGIPGGSISNAYGSVAIELTKDFSGSIEAKTSFGDVDSDIPLEPRGKVKEHSYGPKNQNLFGKVGNGNGKLTVENSYGDISIRKK